LTEVERIVEEYDRMLHGSPWYGDPVWQILDSVSAESAAQRSVADAHTIWEIVLHMTFWEGVGARRLSGQRAGLDEALNFPTPPAATETNWQKTRDAFRASNQEFREALAKLDAARLDELSAAGKRSFYEEAHGVIQHDVYHAGQIAMLQKGVVRNRPSGGL
jgi:uncharacterized damage-inducible protein DinB